MKTIEKKVAMEFFDALASGKKKYELRLNEFEVEEGDTMLLREWNREKKEYTGRELTKKVTYAHVFKIEEMWWPEEDIMEKGILVLSLE